MHSLKDFADTTFKHLGLGADEYIDIQPSLFRPSDITYSIGDPKKAYKILDWKPKTQFNSIIKLLVDSAKLKYEQN